MIAHPNIPAAERCIVALDVPDAAQADEIVQQLDGLAAFYKIGLELFAAGDGRPLLDALVGKNLKVFADMKLFDVPETVARATRRIADSGADFLTVHGDDAIMAAAARAKGDKLKIIAVTVLTSLDQADIEGMGFAGALEDIVLSRARRAIELGCDGIVCSGMEISALRQHCDAAAARPILVTPGIRPADSAASADDQKRITTPAAAIRAGGDYLVVGRPIKNANDRRAAFSAIINEIKQEIPS